MANVHLDEMPEKVSRLNGQTAANGRQECQPGSAGGQDCQPDSFGSLKGQTAAVTGGGRGIGRAICLELARAGAHVVIGYGHNRQEAEETADACRRLGPEAQIVEADVSELSSSKKLIDEAYKAYGRLDILVNNAGITRDGLFMRMSDEDWDAIITTNLSSVYRMSKAVIRSMMKKRGGRIISISSVVGVIGNAGQTNYAAAKAGIIGFTKSLAREVASRGVTVNAVAPGFIATDMTSVLTDAEKEKILSGVPMGHLGTPEDIA
ncbi:MAG TPA: hypothetical protein DHV79_11340, partial [Lachnospiraceae bacterium]|nr:hypothetical protein [Lachnospiraceae bacterium]